MLVVWELNQELVRCSRIAEREPHFIFWGNLGMADGADRGLGASEELLTVTADTCVVAGEVRDIRKVARGLPILGRNLVARITGLLMLFGDV